MHNEINQWHITSYPRSGNHLVRSIIEFVSQRPTFGCNNRESDPPIYLRRPNQELRKIIISDPKPIGFKSHSLHEIKLVQCKTTDPLGLIFIQRNMEDAIFSHTYRILDEKLFLSDRRLRITIEQQIDFYLSSLFFFESYQLGPKIHIRFEDISEKNTSLAMHASKNFLSEMGLDTSRLKHIDFEQITKLARESQSSINKNRNSKLEARIRTEISRYI